MSKSVLELGSWRRMNGAGGGAVLRIPAYHLVTHGVVVGMTGSGKTGLITVIAEEALRAKVPTLVIDVKGDLQNLLLTLPAQGPEAYLPWLQSAGADGSTPLQRAAEVASERQAAFTKWSLTDADVARFAQETHFRVLTPGASSGEALHVFSSLERRSARWDTDPESSRAALSAAVSLVLRLLGRDPDPAKSKEHVLLSVLAERRLMAGQDAALPSLMTELTEPPIAEIGALQMNAFIRKSDRVQLAAALNTLLASPTFASWRQGASLDPAEWFRPVNGRTPCVIVSVAHLDDEERALVLGVLFEEVLSWVRGLSGSQRLEALVILDEAYGFLPPHPANPPTKRPLVALMKQARAFGVGVLVATQNPMDLDYRSLSNAGLWFIGRLQTDADRGRVVDGLASGFAEGDLSRGDLGRTVQRLKDRWFIVRNAHAQGGPVLLQARHALSWMRGPMTRSELRMALEGAGDQGF